MGANLEDMFETISRTEISYLQSNHEAIRVEPLFTSESERPKNQTNRFLPRNTIDNPQKGKSFSCRGRRNGVH
jgi:hypothetical protein